MQNCESHIDFNPKKCEKCIQGFVILKKNPLDYCYKIPPNINCKDAELMSNTVEGSVFKCTECQNQWDFLTTENIDDKSKCLEFTEIN